MRTIALAAIGAATMAIAPAPALAQEGRAVPGFGEAVALCRDAMLARVPLAELPRASEALVLAGPDVRAAHPLGSAPFVWLLVGRSDANITLVEQEPKNCSVFAVDADVTEAFDAAALVLSEEGVFSEGAPTNRRSGGTQRNFRSADGNARVELQTFGEGDDILTMALFGRRR
jgi:hypothetical protein